MNKNTLYMKAQRMNLINGLILVTLGGWGFIDVNTPLPETGMSLTALIPVVFGIILLLCNSGIKNSSKLIAHIAVVITLLILVGLGKPLMAQIDKGGIGLIRVSVMMLTSILALVAFIRSFIENRKKAS